MMIDLPDTLELLSHRVEDLEKRVMALEHPAMDMTLATPSPNVQTAAPTTETPTIERTGGIFPVFGSALLGIAGAYILRAVASSSALPRGAIAAVAIAYAAAWLVWAAKAKGAAIFARAIYAGTSALILAPMLWELTLQFKVLSPVAAAVVLASFVVGATVLAWSRELAVVFAMAYGTAAVTAFALSVATHSLAPFIAALLMMVLLCEFAVVCERGAGIRLIVAALTDAAIWVLIFIYAGPANARTEYADLSTAVLLAPAWLAISD
jgi:hypothetical protein